MSVASSGLWTTSLLAVSLNLGRGMMKRETFSFGLAAAVLTCVLLQL